MPDAPDDEPPEPLQVMRKRRNGVYRADTGFSGPTRRYVLIVALLVLLASVPTAAAITAGTNELADGKSDTLDIPVLPPASPGPVRRTGPGGYDRPPPPASAARSSMQGASAAEAAVRAGRLMRGAGRPPGSAPDRKWFPDDPAMAAFPALPGLPRLPGLAALPGMSARSSGSDQSPPPAEDPTPEPSVSPTIGENTAETDDSAEQSDDDGPGRGNYPSPANLPRARKAIVHIGPGRARRSFAEHRPPGGRSEHRRRSTVAERPHNAGFLDRDPAQGDPASGAQQHDNRRRILVTRGEDNRPGRHAYDGSHRAAGRHHRVDETPAQRRNSRIGRHHAEPTEDLSGRW